MRRMFGPVARFFGRRSKAQLGVMFLVAIAGAVPLWRRQAGWTIVRAARTVPSSVTVYRSSTITFLSRWGRETSALL